MNLDRQIHTALQGGHFHYTTLKDRLTNTAEKLWELQNRRTANGIFVTTDETLTEDLFVLPQWRGRAHELTSVNLDCCGLTAIPKSLQVCHNLKHLAAGQNLIRMLPEELLEAITNSIEYIELSHNLVEEISPSIGIFSKLGYLDLSENNLRCFELRGSTPLPNLRNLRLDGNDLRAFPTDICALTNLEELNLSANRIPTIPDSIAYLGKLRTLYLMNNEIEVIPLAFGSLYRLEKAFLSSNCIRAIHPDVFHTLTSLCWLYIFDNQLEDLPDSIGECSSLHHLYAQKNRLRTFPASVCHLRNLHFVNVSHNQITSFPLELGLLVNVQQFTFDDNPMIYPDTDQLRDLGIIEHGPGVRVPLITFMAGALWQAQRADDYQHTDDMDVSATER
eukprot:Clim_evm12s220 gene=Clim_evmTU12s220